MKILHVAPHLGGGIGTVVLDWIEKDKDNIHTILCLDSANGKACKFAMTHGIKLYDSGVYLCMANISRGLIQDADIVLFHFWDHDTIPQFLKLKMPDCRIIFWCHKNYQVPQKYLEYPDRFFDTSPIQGHGQYIWSTGNMERFFNLEPVKHEGFNIGYVGTVGYQKIHPHFIEMCKAINIPKVRFTVVGDVTGTVAFGEGLGRVQDQRFTFTGKVDDVAPYLAEMDVFGYPLRSDHYGTCEQALGEAMAAGIVPIVMDNPAEKTVVFSGNNGMVVDTEERYIHWVNQLYLHPKMRQEMSVYARNSAKFNYSIDTMISKWNSVFDDIMKEEKKEHAL
jgi:glycosyltransferase involved in cell wall biosynthesis